MTMTLTEDCRKDGCKGTAFWEISCKCYVCSTCGHHNKKQFCTKCEHDNEDDQFTLEESM